MFTELAYAMSGGAQGGGAGGGGLGALAPLIIMFVIFYFLLIRPQQKKAKVRQKMLEAIKSAPSLQAACDDLVAAANQAGGHDNSTVVLVGQGTS